MILMKIFVAIILTKLQHFEKSANVKKTYRAAGPGIPSPSGLPEVRMVKIDVIFEFAYPFYLLNTKTILKLFVGPKPYCSGHRRAGQ